MTILLFEQTKITNPSRLFTSIASILFSQWQGNILKGLVKKTGYSNNSPPFEYFYEVYEQICELGFNVSSCFLLLFQYRIVFLLTFFYSML